jgi:hypothetical protein
VASGAPLEYPGSEQQAQVPPTSRSYEPAQELKLHGNGMREKETGLPAESGHLHDIINSLENSHVKDVVELVYQA